MDTDTVNAVLEFVARSTRFKGGLTVETKLVDDIGLDGDDAIEFLNEFCESFDVDMSSFEFDKYFSGEGVGCLMPVQMVWYLVSRCFGFPTPETESITVLDLVRAVERGEWSSAADR